jgi:lysophospholipase L1-like esterase
MNTFERHPRLTLGVLIPLLVVLTDFGFTGVRRRIEGGRARGEPTLRVRSEAFHHTFAAKVAVQAEHWGPRACAYRTNSLGFRDRTTRDVALEPSGRRIVFMGDSFTEGVGVPYEQTFVGLADAALAPHGVEVLNAAVSLYAPIIYERKTRYLLDDVGLRFQEMVVFIDISDVQDELALQTDADGNVVMDGLVRRQQDRAARRWSRTPGALRASREFLDRHTLVLSRIFDFLARPFESPFQRGAGWTYDPELYEAFGREGLARARTHMDALADLLRSRGIRLTIAVYPWPDQILMRDRDSRQFRFWHAWAEAHAVPLLNYFPLFTADADPERTIRRYFIPGDVHWNEAGHELISAPLIEHLTREGARDVAK